MAARPPLPKRVEVGPYRVTVVAKQDAIDRQSSDAGGKLGGHFNPETLVIALEPKNAHDMQAETLLHELLHAVSEATGKPIGDEDEEKAIRTWTPLLLDTLRRNPELLAYLLADG